MLTKDLNAGYCCSHGLCCFSVISSEGSEAVMAMRQAVAIYKHHLHMAFSEAPMRRVLTVLPSAIFDLLPGSSPS